MNFLWLLLIFLGVFIWAVVDAKIRLAKLRNRQPLPPEVVKWGYPVNDPGSAIAEGWFLELEGRRVAELTDARHPSGEFWFNYRFTPLTDDPVVLSQLYGKQVWDEARVKFRSRKFDTFAPSAFASRPPLPEEGRIWVRGLYLEPDQKTKKKS